MLAGEHPARDRVVWDHADACLRTQRQQFAFDLAEKQVVTRLHRFEAHEVECVLVGLPLTLRGERGAQALETEAFVDALRGIVDVPVETYDERFTTVIATREGGGADEDARAAAHLLESYLAASRQE